MVYTMKRGAAAGGKTLVTRTVNLPIAMYEEWASSVKPATAAKAAVGKLSNNPNQNNPFAAKANTAESGFAYYSFDCSEIPIDATLEQAVITAKCACEDSSNGDLGVIAMDRRNGKEFFSQGTLVFQNITDVNSAEYPIGSSTVITRQDLDYLLLVVWVGYDYGGNLDGATLQVRYSAYE